MVHGKPSIRKSGKSLDSIESPISEKKSARVRYDDQRYAPSYLVVR